MIFYTVCSLSHLYQADILAQSLRAAYPGAELKIGLVDRLSQDLQLGPVHRSSIVEAAEIGIPRFDEMCARYRISELCFACKPFFGRHLLSVHPEARKLVYLDSDIFVFGRFDSVLDALQASDVVLSPHLSSPSVAGTGVERMIMGAGAYNAGFFATSGRPVARDFLDWLCGRLEHECFGWAGDQVWFSLVPSYFPGTYVDRHPGVNMAAWNAADRVLGVRDGQLEVNGLPLGFYHYSGFMPSAPDRASNVREFALSRSSRPDLWLALDRIRQALVTSPLQHLKGRPSCYGRAVGSGTSMPAWMRLLRSAVRKTGFDVVRGSRPTAS